MATVRVQSLKLNPTIEANTKLDFAGNLTVRRPTGIRLPPRQLKKGLAFSVDPSVNTESEPSASQFTSSVGSPSTSLHLSQWNLSQRSITILNLAACVTAFSATWLFCSAIPAMLAFKRAAESLEKLLDVTREELPGTMAAIRLSGMEISDLTMELSDLGQEITKGVRSSTQAVRVAEERLRGLTNMNSAVPLQVVASPRAKQSEPALAKTARGIREGIVKSRSMLQMFFSFTRFSRLVMSYLAKRAKQKEPLNM